MQNQNVYCVDFCPSDEVLIAVINKLSLLTKVPLWCYKIKGIVETTSHYWKVYISSEFVYCENVVLLVEYIILK